MGSQLQMLAATVIATFGSLHAISADSVNICFCFIIEQVYRTLTMCIYLTTLTYLCCHLSPTLHTFTPASQVPRESLLLLELQRHLVNLASTVFSRSYQLSFLSADKCSDVAILHSVAVLCLALRLLVCYIGLDIENKRLLEA